MQESTKTKTFVGGAALMVVAALVSHFASQPRSADDFAKVGEPFFENFDSSSQATSLEVDAVDPETVQRNRFKVAKVDGLWRIPSHDDYPAEASARLATTASSIIGIERESLAGRGKNDYKRLGVVDPLSDEIDDPEEVGQRITLKDENDETLADYIIGKQVDDVALSAADRPFDSGQNRQTYFYVRRADESQTYIVPLKLDLSTKFSDWIDPDLLRFDTSNVSQMTVRNYSLVEQAGGNPLMPQRALVKKDGDILSLTKSDSNEWELAGVEPNEEFDSAGVTDMIGVLEELQIEDVRRKLTFQGKQLLTPDLKVNEDPELMKSPEQFSQAITRLVSELEDKGFNLAGSQQQLQLVSDQGEIEFGTNEGLRYTLYVGAPFEDGDAEIKVAGAVDSTDGGEADESDEENEESSKDEGKSDESAADASDETDPESSDGGDGAEIDDDAKNRYMLVRVAFDQSLLTDQPEAPTKPEKPTEPAGYMPAAAPEDSADSDAADETENGDDSEPAKDESVSDDDGEKADGDKADETKSDSEAADDKDDESKEAPARSPVFEAYDAAMEQHEQAMVDYELGLTRYKDDQKAFAERIETAKKLEAELNERFNEWYYVIAGKNLKALQVSRTDLVTKTKPPVVPTGQAPKELPNRPDISFDGGPDDADEEAGTTEDSSEGAGEEEAADAAEMEADEAAVGETESAEPANEEVDESAPATEEVDEAEPASGDVTEPASDSPEAEPVPKPPTTPPAATPATPAPGVPATPAPVVEPPAVEPAAEPTT
ncbi:DUF4340 domain-containing protein [Mariniblastus sp.]|nr:DUF4340 domain-containing protein [Mariniblastus sp.]